MKYLQDSTDSSIDKAETSLDWQEYFSQIQDTTAALPCHIHLPVCLWIMDPHSRAPKKNTSHGNEVLPQDTTQLIQRPCHQRGSPCQDPAGNWTTPRPPDDRKETRTAVVWSCFPFIRSGKHHLARRQGGQRKRWEDNIREWIGLEFGRAEGSGEQGKVDKLVAKSSVVLQRPSRLIDWWWWWWWWWWSFQSCPLVSQTESKVVFVVSPPTKCQFEVEHYTEEEVLWQALHSPFNRMTHNLVVWKNFRGKNMYKFP